jgi:mannose-6-phosphate isomerase-like protein (cupin superfamily)
MKCLALISAVAFATLAGPAFAQNGGITVWPKGVPPGNPKQTAQFGDHTLQIAHRDADGRAELHKNKADVIVVQSGSAGLLTGGEVVDPVPTGENEIQGTGIKGGVRREVGVGDVIEIPAGVPHQFFLKPGTQITYVLVKIIKTPGKP